MRKLYNTSTSLTTLLEIDIICSKAYCSLYALRCIPSVYSTSLVLSGSKEGGTTYLSLLVSQLSNCSLIWYPKRLYMLSGCYNTKFRSNTVLSNKNKSQKILNFKTVHSQNTTQRTPRIKCLIYYLKDLRSYITKIHDKNVCTGNTKPNCVVGYHKHTIRWQLVPVTSAIQ